ncbi:alpha/beta hydrolase family protein [Qipengyuania sp.]|uniref:alpha/beta hydrolase family protein n=1 Tax=Qipengyuania sp. TaxID=2004515 RepID=UPI003BAB7182
MQKLSKAAMAVSLVALGGTAMALPAQAETLEETAARYGSRASVLDISLSPSGNKIAFIAPGPQHSEVLNVIDLSGDASVKTIAGNTEIKANMDRCEWATETRLVCQVWVMSQNERGLLLPFDRMFSVNADGSEFQVLTERRSSSALGHRQDGGDIVALDVAAEDGRILMTREYVKEFSTGTRLANEREGLGVDSVDIVSGSRTTLERPDAMASRFIADQAGRIRLKVRSLADDRGILSGGQTFMYRTTQSDSWERLDDITIEGEKTSDFYPVAVDSTRNVAFGFVTRNGFDALAEVSLDGSAQGRMLLARDDVDVDRLIRIGRQRRVVGASYAMEKREVAYFDEELKNLAGSLARALPDSPLINIVGASADENRLLIVASSDTQPGFSYLFDKETSKLEPLLAVREHLVDRRMGAMTPITYPASDGTQIPGYLTLPPGKEASDLPAIVLPHGGPSARDEWGFDWIVQFFVARGYAVLQPNYRGSSGYGQAWYGRNGFKAWDVAIGDVADAGRWLVSEGIADPDRLAIAGWSYGGYAALQSQVIDPELFKAIVAIAPVTDLKYLREDSRGYTNARLVNRFIGEGAHVVAGSPLRHAEKFLAPVALFHGTLDLNVDVRHSRAMARELREAGKQVSYTEYEDLQHSLSDSKVRTEMLTEIDAFLSKALGS